ncbi:MAG: sigma-70 family RNA polymerase sigma factor [Bacteroidales bacterium]|nr:sigma-70 family RNA polymerase sigma factor [Bacteroidales bacterium]
MEYQEDSLIEGCKRKKRKARNKLYKLYANQFLGICLRYTRNTSEAEDVLHDAFIKIFTKIDQYTGKGSFEGWLKRIVVNTAIQSLRERSKTRLVFDENEIDDDRIREDIDVVLPMISAKELMEFIQQLPDGYKVVFNMFVIEDMSHQEIADKLNISVGTSKSQLFRAKKFLKVEVEKRIKELDNI